MIDGIIAFLNGRECIYRNCGIKNSDYPSDGRNRQKYPASLFEMTFHDKLYFIVNIIYKEELLPEKHFYGDSHQEYSKDFFEKILWNLHSHF